MRVVLIGASRDRERLRATLAEARVEIIGEFETVADASTRALHVDAVLLADARILRRPAEPLPEPLTGRELEVLALMAEGLPNKAIAAQLGISDQTIKFHVGSIMGKLGAHTRTGAVRAALTRGLLTF
jgi:DNA-binding NarL/FixJ family response regulator